MPKLTRSSEQMPGEKSTTDPSLATLWGGAAGSRSVNKSSALKTYAAVYGVIDRKSKALAQLPVKMYKKNDSGRERVSDYRSELVGVRPEQHRSAFVYWRTVSAMKEVYGNAYAFIERDASGTITQLKLLHPNRVEPYENIHDNNELYYRYFGSKGTLDIHHMDMLHFPSVYTEGHKGVSFLESLASVLNLNKITHDTGAIQAENSLKISGVIKLAANLSPAKKEEYQQQLKDMYSNGWNSILVLDLGTEYQPIKFDVQDLKMLENNKVTVQQVSMASGVPLYMLAEMDGAKYNNVEQQNMDFVQSCMAPDVIQIEQELNYKLLSPTERSENLYWKFNLNALLRADMKTRADYYARMVTIAAITPNEIRDLEDMSSLGEIGDRPLVTLNTTFLDTLENHERITGAAGKEPPKGGEEDE